MYENQKGKVKQGAWGGGQEARSKSIWNFQVSAKTSMCEAGNATDGSEKEDDRVRKGQPGEHPTGSMKG